MAGDVKYPTLSMVKPLLYDITNGLKKSEFNYEDEAEVGRVFADTILNNLEVRFSEVEDNIVFKKSTYLNPRYKIYFYNEDEVKVIEEAIKTEIMQFLMNDDDSEERSPLTREPIGKQYFDFWSFMKKPAVDIRDKNLHDLRKEISQEMSYYVNSELINPHRDPLLRWQEENNNRINYI
ncbi:uncharacterized protein LOC130675939 [Microplitis mediator]|uniref:uncharacterized protein LOC130675939 n=1 Tax=Microplitis mediator TaxID=375433 RepID=UPI0025543502|nr:uncharacterized protein LOC130675939 [Microplitis mediator]